MSIIRRAHDFADCSKRYVRPVPVKADLSLERNVRETLAVLELAAAERAAEQS